MAARNAGGYSAARVIFFAPPNVSRSRRRGPKGDNPSLLRWRPTCFSTSGAELAHRVGFLASGPPTPVDTGSETRIPKRH
eukprot:4042689-Alexandrium_andersonii.AAC.1